MFFKKYFVNLKNFDWIMLISVFLLACFSLATLYSIALSQKEPDFLNFKKQLFFYLIGFILLIFFSLVDYQLWQIYRYILYIVAAAILVAVLFFGQTLRGTTGWFSALGFNFQPVELAKLVVIIFLANFFTKKAREMVIFKNLFFSGLSVALFFLLVVFQPDFGSALILFLIWFIFLFFLKVKKKHLFLIISLLFLIIIFSWFLFLRDYQKDRILTFFNPAADPYGRGYHVRQAIIAVGAGGILGRGLGFGSQSQLKFIPDSQTDFIFAVIAEELGFLGAGLVLLLFGIFFYRLIKAASRAPDDFSLFFILGASILFFCQTFINIGMNIGLVPVAGISLPFLSYGGSFLISSLIIVGIVENMISKSIKPEV